MQYHQSGVRLVWVVKPVFRTVEVYELARQPQLRTVDDDLLGDPVILRLHAPRAHAVQLVADHR